MLMLFLILLSLVWLVASVVVIAACRMAARGDGELRGESYGDGELGGEPYSPRAPSTWGTVRSRILRSPHSDQLATYR
jgi:hypothetical protein